MKGLQRKYTWQDGKTLEIGQRTLVMGILNITPDSFSDGGKWNSLEQAVVHAKEMIEAGADIIDIGAESSRPGFQCMSAEAEINRLKPILPGLLKEISVPVSIDTFKAETAAYAAEQGIHILNDIWGLQYAVEKGKMAEVAAKYNLPVIVMHNQESKEYDTDIIAAMKQFFRRSLKLAVQAGVNKENIIFDPGIGFGKTVESNLEVMARLDELTELDGQAYPLLLGTSRKSVIGATLDLPVEERMEGTGATCVMGIMLGCSIMRVHDVKEISRMCRMTDAVMGVKSHGV